MDFFLHLLFRISNVVIIVLCYNLIFGKGKILHFGPVGIEIITAYTTFILLAKTENFFLSIMAGIGAALLLSALFAWLSLRLDEDSFGILSIAVHQAILAAVLNWSSVTRGALGIPRIPRLWFLESMESIVFVTVAFAVLWATFLWWLDRKPFGRKLAALAEHEWHAKSLGISRIGTHMGTFLVAGFGIAIMSIIYPQYLHLIHPNDFLFSSLVLYIMCVAAGKPGSVLGVSLATALLVILREALRFVPLAPSILGPVRLILFGLILFGVVWWRRDSLFPKQRSV